MTFISTAELEAAACERDLKEAQERARFAVEEKKRDAIYRRYQGTVQQRSDGQWRYSISIKGWRKGGIAPTKAHANARLNDLRAEMFPMIDQAPLAGEGKWVWVSSAQLARRRNGRDQISNRLRFDILTRDNFRCQICGATAADGAKLAIDHRRPYAKDGPTTKDNLWTVCFECNMGKFNRIIESLPAIAR